MRSILRKLEGIVFAIAMASTTGASAKAGDPVIGTWKLNVGKSKFSRGPGPRMTGKHEPAGAGATADTVSLKRIDGRTM